MGSTAPCTRSGLRRGLWLVARHPFRPRAPRTPGEVSFKRPIVAPPRSASVTQDGLVLGPLSPHRRLVHAAVAAALLLNLARIGHRRAKLRVLAFLRCLDHSPRADPVLLAPALPRNQDALELVVSLVRSIGALLSDGGEEVDGCDDGGK